MEHILNLSDLADGEQESVVVDDFPALAVRIGDAVHVLEDVCTHDGQPLGGGLVSDGGIACPRHGARFDLKTGDALCMPATKAVQIFAVEVRGDEVWAGIAAKDAAPTAAPKADSPVATKSLLVLGSLPAEPLETDTTVAAGSGDPSTENDYLEALRQVIDPELMINIVDLGLIYSVEQDEDLPAKVKVDMTLTSPACPAGPQLVQQSKMALERLHDVDEAVITLVMAPPWTPERMTDDARDQLGIF